MQGLNQKRQPPSLVPIAIVTFGLVLGLFSQPLPALAELRFTPSLTVSERYDSNILLTSGGSDKDDFVTTVSPALSAKEMQALPRGDSSAHPMVSTH